MAGPDGVRRQSIRRLGCGIIGSDQRWNATAVSRSLARSRHVSDDASTERVVLHARESLSAALSADAFAPTRKTTDTASSAGTMRSRRSARVDAISSYALTSPDRFTARAAGRHFMASRRNSKPKAAKSKATHQSPRSQERDGTAKVARGMKSIAKKVATNVATKVVKTTASAKKAVEKSAKKVSQSRDEASRRRPKRRRPPRHDQSNSRPKRKQLRKPAFNQNTDSANDPNWVAPVWDDDLLLGAHVSIAGGTHEAPRRARAIGATAMQIFTKMANRWAERVCEDDECRAFRDALAEHARARDDRARFVSDQPRQPRRRRCDAGRSSRSSPSCSDARRSG